MPSFMASFANESLLLSLLRGEAQSPSPGAIAEPSAFVDLCRRHRVASLAYQAASRREGLLPPETLAALRETARKTLVDNLILLKALRDLASALTEEGTGFLLLKGASLLGFLYPEIQQRPMSDLDILIREKDWPKVAETLGGRGYRLPSEGEERYYQEFWYHQLVETPGSPSCYVEFHWNLESVERSRIDPDELIRDALACEIEGERFLRLCDDHLLLHLAVHLAHHHCDPSLHWVEDLRRLLALGSLDWDRVKSTARMWGVENCLAYSLAYVEKVFPGTVPEPARRFAFSPLRRSILGGLRTENPVLPHRPLGEGPLRHVVSMSLLDRWSDVGRYVAVHSVSRIARALGVSRVKPPGRSGAGKSPHPAGREGGIRSGPSGR